MKTTRRAGLSSGAGVAAGVAALFASLVSLGSVLALFASASGERDEAMAKARAGPAPSASLAAGLRKAGSG